VEVDVLVPGQPAVVLGLVGVEVVEHDVDLGLGVGREDFVHEVQELASSTSLDAGLRPPGTI